jgi:DNA repair exonuclease SbcCD ATPase subunit
MNTQEPTKFFRESLKGFNKDDVTAFIKKLSRDYTENEEKYKERIAGLTAANKAKDDELEETVARLTESNKVALRSNEEAFLKERDFQFQELKKKNAELEKQAESMKLLVKSSAADMDKYKDDANKLLGEVRSKDAEIIELKKSAEEARESGGAGSEMFNELSAQIAELSAGNEKLRAEKDAVIADLENRIEQGKEKFENEQKMYESITADLGSTIYSARKSAEDITAKALAEAEDIIARANAKKLATLEENEKNNAQFREKYDFIKNEHEKIIGHFRHITEKYSSKLLEIGDAINNISEKV